MTAQDAIIAIDMSLIAGEADSLYGTVTDAFIAISAI
jgi:hypothetical protein